MKFKDLLAREMKAQHLTGTKLSEMTGISQPMISNYKNGMEPPPDTRLKICNALGIEDPQLEAVTKAEKYSVAQAAQILEMSKDTFKLALINDVFRPQIGFAVKHPGGHYTYEIFKKRLDLYKDAKDMTS